MNNDHVFYVQAFYNGGMNSFEVIPNDAGTFSIAFYGEIIAELSCDDSNWKQISGERLPDDAFVSICQEIDTKKA